MSSTSAVDSAAEPAPRGDETAGLDRLRRCSGWEARANLAFAISAAIAAVMRVVNAAPSERLLPAVIGVSVINALIAILFLLRRPVVFLGSAAQLLSCLPSMIGFGLALKLSPNLGAWPWYAHALFTCGAILTIAAFLTLGRSFGVMPAIRAAVTRGPYQFVRHPAYLAELLMATACFVAGPSQIAIVPWLVLLPGVIWRILAEESVLVRDDQYASYQRQVRWRLLPGIW